LACLNALAEDALRREVLGPNVEIRLPTYDETNRRVRPDRIIKLIRKQGGRALIGLVGVQSNQFPRAVDLARPFLARYLHRRLSRLRVHRHAAGDAARYQSGASDGHLLFRGRKRGRPARRGPVRRLEWYLKPLYNYIDKLPALTGEPPPFLSRKHVQRTSGQLSSIDLGRGCPYQCSFCTIINVQGRKSRFRTPDDLEHIVRENHAQGIKRASSSLTTISRATATGNCCSTV
jgi:hypothetical protein